MNSAVIIALIGAVVAQDGGQLPDTCEGVGELAPGCEFSGKGKIGYPCNSGTENTGCEEGLRCAKISGAVGDVAQGIATAASVAPPLLYAQGTKEQKN